MTIEGSNLGYRADQVNQVTVAGVRCDVNAAEYRVSTGHGYCYILVYLLSVVVVPFADQIWTVYTHLEPTAHVENRICSLSLAVLPA